MVDLHKLTIEELVELRRQVDSYLSTWFGFSDNARQGRTPEWIEQARWRLEDQTATCCECGEEYPLFDLHFGDEIYCSKCRQQENVNGKE